MSPDVQKRAVLEWFDVDRNPSYKLLFDGLEHVAGLTENKLVLGFERTALYGGVSVFSPWFHRSRYLPIDHTQDPLQADAFNADFARGMGLKPSLHLYDYDFIGEAAAVVIPNLIHHFPDPRALLGAAYHALAPGGTLFVFDVVHREIHQAPHDYQRLTPYGIAHLVEEGFEMLWMDTAGTVEEIIGWFARQAGYDTPPILTGTPNPLATPKDFTMAWALLAKRP